MSSQRSEIPSFNFFSSPVDMATGEKFRRAGVYVRRVHCVLVVAAAVAVVVAAAVFAYMAFARRCPSGAQEWQRCQQLSRANNASMCARGLETLALKPRTYPKNIRLPPDVIPRHYNLELTPFIYGDDTKLFHFVGVVEIHVRCVKRTDTITLHLKELQVYNKSISLEALGGSSTAAAPKWTSYKIDSQRDFFILQLDNALEVGERYRLRMSFRGELPANKLVGMYKLSYQQDNATKWMVATQLEPTYARRVFPCFDEPALKATFNVTLVRQRHMTTISNMPVVSRAARPNSWIADEYEVTKTMSTYLLAFVVCEFEYRERNTTDGTTQVRVWTRRDAINQADYALDISVKILQFFERYFDIPFPLPKLDMIAIPNFGSGAMENWGLITYRETAMLYTPAVTSENSKRRVAYVISHELAHQWFGNLVTLSWWDDLWLNEGFATYVEYIGVDFIHPEWRMMDQFVVSDLHYVMRMDSKPSSHPIRMPVSHPDQISEMFDSISYGKGGAVLRMLRHFLGNSTFQKGLTKYLREFAYKNAHHDDLWRNLNEQARHDNIITDVAQIMNTWILQMGYPVVTVLRDKTTGTAEVTQQRFLMRTESGANKTDDSSPYGYKWIIPFTYALSGSTGGLQTKTALMNMSGVTLHDLNRDREWILGNIGQYGYYRVNYDTSNWIALTRQLYDEHTIIPAVNRAQILDDAFALGRASYIDQLIAMHLVGYLKNEADYVPLKAGVSNLRYVGTMLSRSAAYGSYKQFVLDIISPLFRFTAWDDIARLSQLDKFLRVLLIKNACALDEASCLQRSIAMFNNWMQNPSRNSIPADLKGTIYCTAIRKGGQAEWDFAYAQYKRSNIASERTLLLFSLACTDVPWMLGRYLNMAMNASEIRSQDFSRVIASVSRNTVGRYLAWDYIRSNWEAMKQYTRGSFLRYIIAGTTGSFNTKFEYEQLEDFHRQHPNMGAAENAMKLAKDTTKANIRWMETNEKRIHNWLTSTVT